jgi:subtilisin-like proprotein convertase family protein
MVGVLGALLCSSSAGAATFTNPAPMTVNSGDTNSATPYPSEILVSGIPGPITDVNVRINGLTHNSPGDLGFVLVGPGGQALLLGDDVGDNANPAAGVNLTLDDSAPTQLPGSGPLASGSFTIADYFAGNTFYDLPGPGTAYASPGPANGNSATLASVYNGQAANGTWSLFLRDFVNNPSGGTFAGGWGLDIQPSAATAPTTQPAAKKKKCKRKSKKRAAPAAKKKCKKKKRR